VPRIQLARFLNRRREHRNELKECLFGFTFEAGDDAQHVMQSSSQSVVPVLGVPAQLKFDIVLGLVPQSSVPRGDDCAGEIGVQSGLGDDFLI
jgi:hypothetical protein